MIRATAISIVDQGLLSGVNLLLALVLIRFAPPEEYGLYTQLIGLQALFSVLHAGLFVSAFLAEVPRLAGNTRAEFRAGMARAELVLTGISMVAVAVLTWWVAALLEHPISFWLSAAAAAALMSLWWREFVRAGYFADLDAWRVLRLDAAFAILVLLGVTFLLVSKQVSSAGVLSCVAIAGVAVTVLVIVRKARESRVDRHNIRANLALSWQAARWEVLTSIVTWTHAQSFVYFAAMQGGLRGAAQISAARLLTMPLALVWASYANILRPNASRLLAAPDGSAQLGKIARRSVLFVLALALSYAIALSLGMPLLEAVLFGDQFGDVRELSLLWLVYFSLTGLTTIAASVLRSSNDFKAVFLIHACCAAIAVLASIAGLAFDTPAAFVIVLIAVELLLAALLWRHLYLRLRDLAAPTLPLRSLRRV